MTDYLKRSQSSIKRIGKKILTLSKEPLYSNVNAIAAECHRSLDRLYYVANLIPDQVDRDRIHGEIVDLDVSIQVQVKLGADFRDQVHRDKMYDLDCQHATALYLGQ